MGLAVGTTSKVGPLGAVPGGGVTGVAHDGAEFGEQGAEAMHRGAIVKRACGDLGECYG